MKLLPDLICDECETYSMVYDETKGEAYCLECGLIHQEDYTIFSIVKDIERIQKELEEDFIKDGRNYHLIYFME